MTSSQYISWVNTWMSTVKSLTGVEPMIYTSQSFITGHNLNNLASYGYNLWVCDPNYPSVTTPRIAPWTNWVFWQYGVAKVPGIPGGTFNGQTGVTNLDIFNGDSSKLQKYVIRPDKIGVFRNGYAAWFLDYNGNGVWDSGDVLRFFGISGDQPVVGYWNQ
jgi:GH25 family lysozyme M1 (1,4-beta-N-acetylmuramidase)